MRKLCSGEIERAGKGIKERKKLLGRVEKGEKGVEGRVMEVNSVEGRNRLAM